MALTLVTGNHSDPSLAELVPSWNLAMRAAKAATATMKLYNRGVAAYLEWCDAAGQNATLARAQVQTFIAESMEELGREPSTMESYLKGVKAFAKWCLAEGEIATDEVARIPAPKVEDKNRPAITLADHDKLLATCDRSTFAGKRDRALLMLMRDSGGRASEVCGFGVDDVRIGEGFALVHGKGSKDRFVGFSPDAAAALDRYWRARRGHAHVASPMFWLGQQTPAFGYSALWNMIERRCVLAGIPKIHPHMYRRMWANEWLDAGGTAEGLKSLAGWSSWAMVEHYTGQMANRRALREQKRLRGEP